MQTVVDFGRQLPNTNLHTLAVTVTVIAFMVVMNELVKPRAAKLCRLPIPAELIAVCGGTLASHLLQLGSVPYAVHLVGDIPLGFPAPELPPVRLIYAVALDAVAITIVSYSVTVSMAMILAKKQNYEVRPNQELLALGLSNLVGGLFSCVPNGTSLSRSLIQEQTGGRTQFASVVSAALITLILLWIAPVFEVLPRVSFECDILTIKPYAKMKSASRLGSNHVVKSDNPNRVTTNILQISNRLRAIEYYYNYLFRSITHHEPRSSIAGSKLTFSLV